jgi:hypothetical protein
MGMRVKMRTRTRTGTRIKMRPRTVQVTLEFEFVVPMNENVERTPFGKVSRWQRSYHLTRRETMSEDGTHDTYALNPTNNSSRNLDTIAKTHRKLRAQISKEEDAAQEEPTDFLAVEVAEKKLDVWATTLDMPSATHWSKYQERKKVRLIVAK